MRTGEETTIKLSDYRDKLIILDFWANWCSPCIYSLNRLDTISRHFQDDRYIIIPVTYQSDKEAALAYGKYRWPFIGIVADSILSKVFPHNSIPHMVWIQNGEVIAIPQAQYATVDNFIKLMNGEKLDIPVTRKYAAYDNSIPLFENGNGGARGYAPWLSMVSEAAPELPQKRGLDFFYQGDTTVITAYNWPIHLLYYEAFKGEIFGELSRSKGVLWEVSEITFSAENGNGRHTGSGRFCYHLWFPHKVSKSDAMRMMQQDLNRYFGYSTGINGQIETKRMKFAVLRLTGTKEEAARLLMPKEDSLKMIYELDLPDRYFQQNHVLSGMKYILHKAQVSRYPIINLTGLEPSQHVSFELTKKIDGNLQRAKEELNRYGIDIVEELLEVPVLVIREKY